MQPGAPETCHLSKWRCIAEWRLITSATKTVTRAVRQRQEFGTNSGSNAGDKLRTGSIYGTSRLEGYRDEIVMRRQLRIFLSLLICRAFGGCPS